MIIFALPTAFVLTVVVARFFGLYEMLKGKHYKINITLTVNGLVFA